MGRERVGYLIPQILIFRANGIKQRIKGCYLPTDDFERYND